MAGNKVQFWKSFFTPRTELLDSLINLYSPCFLRCLPHASRTFSAMVSIYRHFYQLHGRTPLSQAAAEGHETVVKLLAERDDPDADSKDDHGRAPLSWAAISGLEAVVRLMAERDDVDADSKS
jgi:ankyrin repeat protein